MRMPAIMDVAVLALRSHASKRTVQATLVAGKFEPFAFFSCQNKEKLKC